MADTGWDEVGQRFAELGRQIQDAWDQSRADRTATSELKDANDKVRAALDEVADTINRAAGSPQVHEATRRATSSVAEALSTTLHQVAGWIERAPPPPPPSS